VVGGHILCVFGKDADRYHDEDEAKSGLRADKMWVSGGWWVGGGTSGVQTNRRGTKQPKTAGLGRTRFLSPGGPDGG